MAEIRPGTRVPMRWWEHTGINWKAAREKAAAKEGDDEAEAADPELMGSDLEPEADTPGGTAGRLGGRRAWEQAAPVEQSGAEWSGVERSGAEWSGVERSRAERGINLSGRDPKIMTK